MSKKLQVTIIVFDVLKIKILFNSTINMMIVCPIIIKMLENPILTVDFSRFLKNASICNEIFDFTKWVANTCFVYFQVNRSLKYIMYFQIVHIIVIIYQIFNLKVILKHHIEQSI